MSLISLPRIPVNFFENYTITKFIQGIKKPSILLSGKPSTAFWPLLRYSGKVTLFFTRSYVDMTIVCKTMKSLWSRVFLNILAFVPLEIQFT